MRQPQDQYSSIYYSTLIASIGGLIVGYSTVIISGVLLFLDNSYKIGVNDQEIVVSVALFSAMFGAIGGGILSNLFGRKTTIIFASLVFMAASVLAFFSNIYFILLISRVVMGFGAGVASMAVPLYISEIVPSNIRGSCVCLMTLLFYLGVLLAYLIDGIFNFGSSWRLTLSSPFIPALGLFLGMCYMPETPQWLMGNNKMEKAAEALGRLRRFVDVEWELENIKESSQFNDKIRVKLWGKGVLKAIFIGCGIAFFMEITGAHSIFYYIPTLLESTKLWDKRAAVDASVYMGVISFLAAFLAILLIDRHGRRKLLLYGTSLMILTLVGLGFIFLFAQYGRLHQGLTLSFFIFFAGFYVVGLGSVGWLLISEIFPLKVRSFLIATAITVKWGVNFFISRFFLTQIKVFGGSLTFWVYAAISLICFLFIYFFVPETGGKSLEAIEGYWLKESEHGN